MTNVTPVLWQTKLHRPPVTNTLVQRPQLFDQLNNGLNRWLTLVCAPAGFGKTTLVSSWIESFGAGDQGKPASLPAAWLSLEETDSDILIFLRYFISAVRTIFDDACPQTFDLLQTRNPPPLEVFANLLSNEMDLLSEDFILVLDDFHNIRGEAVPNLINELLLHWPRPLHLILISRTNPLLPLTRLRANDRLTELRTQTLRFNTEESEQFLNRVLQTIVSERVVKALQDKAEGWIGAMRLVALSIRGQSSMEEMLALINRQHAALVDYLVEEVLEKQFPAIGNFLLKTSMLDNFCVPLCEAVIGEYDTAWDARGCIDWLVREEFFIIPLDNDGIWYRYHHILQKVLRQRLARLTESAMLKDLHGRASTWFEQEGLIDEAIRHALLANDLDQTVGLMERGFRDVLNRSDWQMMESWLHRLPEELIQARPWLLMIRAWYLHFIFQLNELSKCLSQIEALIDEDGGVKLGLDESQLLRGQIAALRSQVSYFSNQMDQVGIWGQEALRLLPKSWRFPYGGALFCLGLSLQARGKQKAAERLLYDSYEALEIKTDAYGLRLLHAQCFNYHNEGQLEKLRQTAELLLQQATYGREALSQAWAHFFLGCVYYQWDELDSAEEHFAAIMEYRYFAHQATWQNGMFGLALVHQARGKNAEAIQIQELTRQADIERIGYVEDSTLSMHARLMLQQGDLDSAYRWANAYRVPIPDHPLFWLEMPHLTRARILLAQNNPPDILEALQILNLLYEIAERTHNRRYKIEILALRALALAALGKTRDSLAELRQAVKLSKVGGFLRVFVDLGPDMQQLLAELAQKDHSVKTIERILAAFPDRSITRKNGDGQAQLIRHSPFPALVEPLTPRERQILVLMQEPISFKEIAYKLGIRYPTVKRHSVNIYGKLAVNSRWDAVARAIELDILTR
jgi:LuxR family maltose regulon positive regulatory protein